MQLAGRSETLSTEVRALREQLTLDADTIRNLENLLQSARERADRATRSEAATGDEACTPICTCTVHMYVLEQFA